MVLRGDDQLFKAGVLERFYKVIRIDITVQAENIRRRAIAVAFAPFNFIERIGSKVAEGSQFIFLIAELVGVGKYIVFSGCSRFGIAEIF